MKFLKYTLLSLSLAASAASLVGCEKEENENGKLDIEFENVVGTSPLQSDGSVTYQTLAGDQFTITTLRYYISNIKLKKADGTEYVQPESYYLVKNETPDSKKFTISNIPAGDYTSLTFTVGVDSVRNVSGVQTGALAPSDMFWSWNSGYIFMKLEGRSPQAPNPSGAAAGGGLVYHVGGFKKGQNSVRAVTPSLNGASLKIRESRTPEVHIKADVLKMFSGTTTIRMNQTHTIHMPGATAMSMSANYAAGMFAIDHIHNN